MCTIVSNVGVCVRASVCVRGTLPALPFLSYNGLYCQGQRNATSAPGFHQAGAQCVFLPGCSSLSLSSPLNYYVCAHSSVTLNPGFNLLGDRRHRRHFCWSDTRQVSTPWLGKCNYSNEIRTRRFIYLWAFEATTSCSLCFQTSLALIQWKKQWLLASVSPPKLVSVSPFMS